MQPKVSVIMPVYNAQQTLRRSVDSILSQTLRDIEIILIDDGSIDQSGKICDIYKKADSRVRVVHQPNLGVSVARQKGIEAATGNYIIHVDSDDYAEPEMLEKLYKSALESGSDMVICDYFETNNERERYVRQCPKSFDCSDIIDDILFQRLHGVCWNKLVLKRFIREKNITFSNGVQYSEDTLFNLLILNNSAKVSYLPEAFYHYDVFSNKDSLLRGNRSRLWKNAYTFWQRLRKTLSIKDHKDGFDFQCSRIVMIALPSGCFRPSELKLFLKTLSKTFNYKRFLGFKWKILLILCVDFRMLIFFNFANNIRHRILRWKISR